MNSVQWEDYKIIGDRCEEAADFLEKFMQAMFPDPEDRLYMDENYFSMMAHKTAEAEEKFGVTFELNF